MDPDSTMLIFVFALAVIFFIFLSMAETTYGYLNDIKVLHMIEKEEEKASKIERILNNKPLLVKSLFMGKILSQLALLVSLFYFSIPYELTVYNLAVWFILILMFLKTSELIVKSIALSNGERLSFLFADVICLYLKLWKPFFSLFNFRKEELAGEPNFSDEEFNSLISIGVKKKLFSPEKLKVLEKVFLQKKQTVKSAMTTHRTGIVGIELKSTFEKVEEMVISSDFDYFPVYSSNLDNIIGLLHRNEFEAPPEGMEFCLEHVMRDNKHILYTLCTTPCETVLKKMREHKIYFAVVLDEYGGTEGIVTMEDILNTITY